MYVHISLSLVLMVQVIIMLGSSRSFSEIYIVLLAHFFIFIPTKLTVNKYNNSKLSNDTVTVTVSFIEPPSNKTVDFHRSIYKSLSGMQYLRAVQRLQMF